MGEKPAKTHCVLRVKQMYVARLRVCLEHHWAT